MRELDDTDRELLRLLLEDARRPYSELSDRVDLSPPAVSARIDRLADLGIIRRFTTDIDRSRFREGVRLLVMFDVDVGRTDDVRAALGDIPEVECVFVTADSRVIAVATLPDGDVERHLRPAFDTGVVAGVDVSPIVADDWNPAVGGATIGLECVECGNTVTSEGISAEIGGERYEFCCESCFGRFEARYEELNEGA